MLLNVSESNKKQLPTGLERFNKHFEIEKSFSAGVKHDKDHSTTLISSRRNIRGTKKKILKKYQTSLFTQEHKFDAPVLKLPEVVQKEEQLFSSQKFSDLSLHPHLVSCLREKFGATCMTSVQKQAIPVLLSQKDALVKSLTGSGKTMAYVVPIVQQLQKIRPKLKRSDGIYALVIVPTRELAIQSYENFEGLCRSFTWIVPGCFMGGEKKKSEKARLRKGLTILVSTPGRFVDHMEHTTNLILEKVCWLIIDEADRLVDLGFEKSVSQIIQKLNEVQTGHRQTVLLSATLSKGIEELAGLALKNPTVIDMSADSQDNAMATDEFVVPKTLKQFYVTTPVKLRLVAMSSFLIDKCVLSGLKALVFMATQDMVDFHFSLFEEALKEVVCNAGYNINFFKLHGNMKQDERTEVFKKFRSATNGILLCTDVAARGLHLPRVDWIVQFNVPSRPEDYVHRVGRTARIGSHGQSLMFLLPSEMKFLEILQSHKMNLQDLSLEDLLKSLRLVETGVKKNIGMEDLATKLQLKYETLVNKNSSLLDISRKAYSSFVRAYSSYPKAMRCILPFNALHLGHLAKSFCLHESPSELGMKVSNYVMANRKSSGYRGHMKRPKPTKRNISEFDSGLKFSKGSKRMKS